MRRWRTDKYMLMYTQSTMWPGAVLFECRIAAPPSFSSLKTTPTIPNNHTTTQHNNPNPWRWLSTPGRQVRWKWRTMNHTVRHSRAIAACNDRSAISGEHLNSLLDQVCLLSTQPVFRVQHETIFYTFCARMQMVGVGFHLHDAYTQQRTYSQINAYSLWYIWNYKHVNVRKKKINKKWQHSDTISYCLMPLLCNLHSITTTVGWKHDLNMFFPIDPDRPARHCGIADTVCVCVDIMAGLPYDVLTVAIKSPNEIHAWIKERVPVANMYNTTMHYNIN